MTVQKLFVGEFEMNVEEFGEFGVVDYKMNVHFGGDYNHFSDEKADAIMKAIDNFLKKLQLNSGFSFLTFVSFSSMSSLSVYI